MTTLRTLVSLTKCEKEEVKKVPEVEQGVPEYLAQTLAENPMIGCDKAACQEYSVTARGFFSMYKEKMQVCLFLCHCSSANLAVPLKSA